MSRNRFEPLFFDICQHQLKLNIYHKRTSKGLKVFNIGIRNSSNEDSQKYPSLLEVAADKEKFKEYKCDKIFIVTEDIDYLNAFQKEFKDKLIYLKRPRSRCSAFFSHNIHFENYSRNSHRYKLGKEILIDSLLLSDSPIFIYFGSNIARFSIFYSRFKQKRFQISTELNSNNRFYARWKWYLKVYFPFFFKKITYLIK
jgi:hypothetical protein